MKKILALGLAVGLALSAAGCSSLISKLQTGTVALVNFNNALITLDVTIIGDLTAEVKAFAPVFCGAVSLSNSLGAQPAIATAVDSLLHSKQAQTTATRISVTATALCQSAGLGGSASVSSAAAGN